MSSKYGLPHKIKLEIPANLSFSLSIRSFSEDIFKTMKFNKDWINRLKSVVDELFMNTVKYGSTENQSIIDLEFQIIENGIQISISDDGTGKIQHKADEIYALINQHLKENDAFKDSGRGLAVFVKQWSDKFEIKDNNKGGLTFVVSKYISNS